MLFLHDSYGTPEFPNCGNLVGTDWMEDLRWANMEPTMHFRETNTDLPVHFRKANTDLSMHFRKVNTKFLVPALLPNLLTISLASLYPFLPPVVIPTYLHHNKWNVIRPSSHSNLCPLYSLCFVHSFLFWSKVASLQFPANGPCRKRPTLS